MIYWNNANECNICKLYSMVNIRLGNVLDTSVYDIQYKIIIILYLLYSHP